MAERAPNSASNSADQQNARFGDQVAKHYNERENTGLKQRQQSRIYFMRNLNNWIKSMAISDTLTEIRKRKPSDSRISVLDLCCGKGGDLLKWKKGRIDNLICVDIADVSIEQCVKRFHDLKRRNGYETNRCKEFLAEFYVADVTKEYLLENIYKNKSQKFDLTSCQFAFHYGFESLEQADVILRNACECLKAGGIFLGTIPNSYEIVKRLKKSKDKSYDNEIIEISVDSFDLDNIPLIGAKYNFHLDEVVDCPEFLVYFPLLEEMAKKYDMRLLYCKPFGEFFDEQIVKGDGRCLIGKMQALEPYPPDESAELVCQNYKSYEYADGRHQQMLEDWKKKIAEGERLKKPHIGTLSQAEWEVVTLYQVFAFIKEDNSDGNSKN